MKIKYRLFFILLLGISLKSFSQSIGNEWINYSQKYFRIDVSEDRVYEIDYNTVSQAFTSVGLSIADVNPKRFQLFGQGSEIAIYIHGDADNSFDPGDYIEFYGRMNNGWFDTRLYSDSLYQPNPYYSLFNDTASYYLTFNNLTNNKRMAVENGTNFSTYTEVPYFLKTSEINFNSNYYLGYLDGYEIGQSEYSEGEGWTSGRFDVGYSYTQQLSTANAFVGGPSTEMEVCTQGRSGPQHSLRIQFPGQTIDTNYWGYPNMHHHVQVATSLLGSSTTPITIESVNDGIVNSNTQSFSYFKLVYPHTLTLENTSTYKLSLPVFGALPKAVLKVNASNIATGTGDNAVFYDLTNGIRITPVVSGTQFTCLVNNLSATKELYLTSEQKFASISRMTPVNGTATFTNFGAEPYLSSDYLIVTHNSLRAEAEQYKTYRQTLGYPVLYTPMIADIDELYDQFSYGIRKNPLAIRNFVRFAIIKFHQTPKNLFLIGKSYRAGEDSRVMAYYRKGGDYYSNTLVPTFGVPPSDNMFTSGLINPNDFSIAIPTGRLSAKVPEHVSLYLNKVREYENMMRTPQPWMKNVLHFAGGTGSLHTDIIGWLDGFKSIIEDTLFGGSVRTFEKTTTEPIQINQSDSLKNIINSGVSLMTFFGHAASNGFDISIDNPQAYNNVGKYPFIIGLSCYAGDLFTSGVNYDMESGSEQFVLIANKGSIAYLASVSTAIDSYLSIYANSLYKNLGQLHYGKSIGYNIQQTINGFASNSTLRQTCLNVTYHGDPAIVLNAFDKPDYVIEPSDIRFNPSVITTEYDSLTINVQLRNIGRAINDSIFIRIKRTFPDNSTQDYYVYVKAPLYSDSISLRMPVNRIKGVGMNQFFVHLDDNSQVDELSENNNSTTVSISIVSSDIIPIYPQKYAVIDSNRVTLIASTGSAFLPSTSFTFEIDTTDLFNSPALSTTIVASGGLVQWNLPLTLTDSTVYYWHVAKTGDTLWRESSFQYIHHKNGWGQAHFFQFKNDSYQLVNYNRPQRKFDFIQDVKSLTAQTGFFGYGMSWTEIWYKINNSMMDQYCMDGNGFKFAVINPISGTPWLNPDSTKKFTPDLTGMMGQYNCKTYSTYGFDFYTSDSTSQERLANFIDSIPHGYYVLALSQRRTFAPHILHLKQAFESFGSTNIITLQDYLPYIIFGKKGISLGNPGDTVVEKLATSPYDVIDIATEYRTNWDQGNITSEIIGPALSWGSVHMQLTQYVSTDTISLELIGITNLGTETLIGTYTTGCETPLGPPTPVKLDIYNLASTIDAHQYPYLKLRYNAKDNTNNTPAQLKSWHVLYEKAPETAIDPVSYFSFYKNPIQEGDSIRFGIATHNISDKNMDSLLVVYRVIHNNSPIWTKTKRLRTHPAGDVLIDSMAVSSLGMAGLNTLQVEFNPNYDQPEQTHVNNIAEVGFNVTSDNINPMLDVTFDGVRIMNGDIVSAKPSIQITLKDENRFLLMNDISDTSKFRVSLKSPTDADFVIIPFYNNGVQLMQFVPASANNKCYVIYRGSFPVDGTYQLEVEAMDKSNNLSGTNKYLITFEVLNKSTITDVMNWPNPFSTATHFVFTLTGSEMPTFFKIQIMTITGKLVREIDLSELGTIHIGRNITDYAWDGKDQYGDQLANGIYFYRVVTNIRGERIEKRESDASKYFTKEFGKMCLIR
jgi:hypothetical protein